MPVSLDTVAREPGTAPRGWIEEEDVAIWPSGPPTSQAVHLPGGQTSGRRDGVRLTALIAPWPSPGSWRPHRRHRRPLMGPLAGRLAFLLLVFFIASSEPKGLMREVTASMVPRHYAAETVRPVKGSLGLLIQSLIAGRWAAAGPQRPPLRNLADKVIRCPAELVHYFIVARTRIIIAREDLILNSLRS